MKIALVICIFGPEELSSGAVRIVYNLAKGLSDKHDVFVFGGSRHFTGGLEKEKLNNFTWWKFPINRSLNPTIKENFNNPEITGYFKNFLEQTNPDIIHFHALQGLGANLLDIAKKTKALSLIHIHDWWWFCPYLFLTKLNGELCSTKDLPNSCNCMDNEFLIKRFRFLKEKLILADLRIFVSNFIYNSYQHYLPDISNIVLENPVSFLPNSKVKIKRNSRIRFSYFGGNSVHKGYSLLKLAVKELRGNYQITYYGFNNVYSSFKDKLSALFKKNKERFKPRFTHEELTGIFENTDVVIVPSLAMESYNLVVREALAAGVPVIASKSGGPEEILKDGKTGWLFPRGDHKRLAKIMQNLINCPELIDTVKKNLQKKVLNFKSQNTFTSEIESIYLQFLNEKKSTNINNHC